MESEHWSYDRLQDVSSQLRVAQQELESLRKETEGVQELISKLGRSAALVLSFDSALTSRVSCDSETQNNDLRQKEEDKRLTNLLCTVLEKREDIRVQRIAQLEQELRISQ